MQAPNRIDDEDGFTLTEVVVAMGLLMIFMAIFTTVTLMMTNTTTKVQRISSAVTQANQAFLALDRTIRYASAITYNPPSSGGIYHVEFDTPVNTSGTTTDQCTQLRVNASNRQLQQRTWTVSGTSYTSLSAWKPLASNVINGSVSSADPATGVQDNRPFDIPDVTVPASQFQRLTITIMAAGNDTTTSLTDPDVNRASMTFAAVNSLASNTNSVCQQVAVDSTS